MQHEYFMKCAFEEAYRGMKNNEGSPFGTVIVLNNEIIGRGNNRVLCDNDPTAHAEIVAIRNACRHTKTVHLDEAILYTNCEPCPMCWAAIYWTNIKTVYYCHSRHDAANIGFSDELIYEELEKPVHQRSIKIEKLKISFPVDLFAEWKKKQDR
jgi:tRNA(Arg) A34 adenosine deaminase TadA